MALGQLVNEMTAKHTPSPWLSDGSTENGDFVIFNENCNHNVIRINHGSINPDDFNLILAAPDMFEVLQMMADKDFELSDYECRLARIALAKAMGEI